MENFNIFGGGSQIIVICNAPWFENDGLENKKGQVQ